MRITKIIETNKKHPEDKNRFRPGYDLQFIAENIFVAAMGHLLGNRAEKEMKLSTETELLFVVEASIQAAIFFQENKGKFGIRDRITDSIGVEGQ